MFKKIQINSHTFLDQHHEEVLNSVNVSSVFWQLLTPTFSPICNTDLFKLLMQNDSIDVCIGSSRQPGQIEALTFPIKSDWLDQIART
jgi:hypothetical protein